MNAQARRENAVELRRTHFSFGNDAKNYETQSVATYTPKKITANNQTISNHGLRKTHFILGSDPVNYLSTIKEQNQCIDGYDFGKKTVNLAYMKKDLAKSHFSLGNEGTVYSSEVMSEFVDKSKHGAHKENVNKGKELRKHNYILGEDMPDYLSQTKITYTEKKLDNQVRIMEENKKDLQKNHYKFGYSNEPLVNYVQNNFAKPVEVNKKNNNAELALESRKTNFILGEYTPDYCSVNGFTYVPHKLDPKNKEEQKKLAKDLRSHHFHYGNDNPNFATINREDFKEVPLNLAKTELNSYLRENHFSIGDVTDKSNIYNTTYNNSIGLPKDLPPKNKIDNNSFKTTYLLKVEEKPDFLTESRANFTQKMWAFNSEEIKTMKNDIEERKKNHFDFGDFPNEHKTTHRENFIYNKNYKDAKTSLEEGLKKDLRATHYKLGYIDKVYKSSHEENYIPLPYAKNTFNSELMADLKRNHFDVKGDDMDEQNRKTIYQLDFSKEKIREKY